MDRPCIFISAVSAELAGARQTAARVLGTLGYDPVSEEDFPTGHGELKAWLTEQIDACEGVIQLVGEAYGAEPPASDDPAHPWPDPQFDRCSYTQYELLYAWRQGKRTWVILMEPGYPRDAPPERLDLPRPDTDLGEASDPAAYQAERRALQQAYIERLKADNHLRHSAGSETELKNLLLRLKDELKALRVGERRRWRRLGWAIAAVLAGLLVLGGGGWFAYERLIDRTDELATVTTERIRAHLLKAVEDAHRRDLAQAEQAADWEERERRREAAAAQRVAQLARIDDLAASFATIERQGEATSVFKELTRILQEPGGGVTQALAYIETKRPDILDDVDRIAESAQTRIRTHLQPLLTSARLYQAEGNAEAARGLYSQILTRVPDWPAALDQNLWFLIEQGDLAVIRGSLPDAKRDYAEAQARAERLLELEPDNAGWQRDLSVSLNKVGDIKTAQGDLAGALKAYEESKAIFERLAAADPSNAGWQRDLSVSLNKVGDIKTAQGDLAGALKAYEESKAIRERLAAADPSNAGWQRDLSVSLNKVGDIKTAQGDLAGALKAYEESKAIFERLAGADPSNAGWQRDLSVSLNKVGDIKTAQGDLAGALKAYEESKAIFERLAAADPSNAGWQRDLSVSLERIGDIKTAQGDLAGALKAYEESKAIAERLAGADPSNAGWQRDLSVSLNKVGDIKTAQGDLAGALKAYEESKAIRERLAAADPSNAGWQRDLSVSLNKVGDIKTAQGDLAGALKAYEESKAIFERLAAADPSNAGWQRDLSVSLNKVGDIKTAQGDLAGALKAYEESKAIFERLAAADPSNAGWQRDLSVSLNKVGDIKTAQGDLAGALKAYEESKAIRERLAAADPSNAGWQRDLSVSLERIGDIKTAQGDLAGALKAYEESKAIRERLAAADPSNAGWQRDLSVSLNKVGDIKTAQGDLAGALKAYEESKAICERLAAADPSNAGWQRDLYVSHWRLAAMAEQRGQPDEALGHWRRAYKVLQDIADRGLHMTPEDLAFLEELRLKLHLADDPGGMAREVEALLERDPDNAELYNTAQALYHELAFDYAAAHRLTTAWVAHHPEDLDARCNLAETLLTTGRTLEARDALADLVESNSEAGNGASALNTGTEAALRLLEIAALTRLAAEDGTGATGDGPGVALTARRVELGALLAAQPEDFTIAWSFRGTLNYIATDQAYADYRDTLMPLFEAAAQGRDALLGRLGKPYGL